MSTPRHSIPAQPCPRLRNLIAAVGAGLARDVVSAGLQILDPPGSGEEGIAGKARSLHGLGLLRKAGAGAGAGDSHFQGNPACKNTVGSLLVFPTWAAALPQLCFSYPNRIPERIVIDTLR